MADYGLSTALKGFLGSSDAKAARNNELALLSNMHQQEQQRMMQNAQFEAQSAQYTDKINEYAQQVISGAGIREKDKEEYKMLQEEALLLLRDDVRRSGDYTKFMLGGGASKLVAYKNAITNSETARRLKNNTAVFAQLQQATDDEGTKNLVPMMMSQQLKMYQNEEIDDLVWTGLLNEYDWESAVEATGMDEQIDLLTLQQHDPLAMQKAKENYRKDLGRDPENDNDVIEYFNRKHSTIYGEKVIKKTFQGEILSAISEFTPTGGFLSTSDIRGLFEGSAAADIINTVGGYDPGEAPLIDGGVQIKSTGRVLEAYQDEIMKEMFGADYNLESGTLSNQRSKGFYRLPSGGKMDDEDIGNRYNIFDGKYEFHELADGDNVTVTGMYFTLKVSGRDPQGNWEEMLVTDSNTEDLKRLKNKKATLALVAEVNDSDVIDDDVYYKEIPISAVMAKLDKKVDINDQLSDQTNQQISYDRKKEREKKRQEFINESNKKAAAWLAGGGSTDDLRKVYKSYATPLNDALTLMDVEMNKLGPHVFTYIMHEAEKKNPKNPHIAAREMVKSFNQISATPKGQELQTVLKEGNVNNFYQWLENNNFESEIIRDKARTISTSMNSLRNK